MKLKSPTETPVKVALLSGHIINVPPEGREVPQKFLADAFKAGCLPAEVDASEVNEIGSDEPSGKDRNEIIVESIKQMLEDGAEMTASTGMPNLKDLSRVAGFTVNRNELVDAWNSLQAEAGKEE